MSITRKRVAAVMAAATALVGASASAANAAAKPSATPSPSTAHLGKATPDITRESCHGITYSSPDHYVQVLQSSYRNIDCFAYAGSEYVAIYNIDDVYTGNNGVTFNLTDDGQYWGCVQPYKFSYGIPGIGSSCENVPYGQTEMWKLSIYPGI